MKNQKGSVEGTIGLIYLLVSLVIFGSWIGNFFKLLDCDFEPSYKEEIIHGIGLVPIISVFTVWYDPEEKPLQK